MKNLAFGAGVGIDHDGYVRWSFETHQAAEAVGIPSVSRGGYVGNLCTSDGSDVRASDLLVALECLASAMLSASRAIAPTRPLFGDGIEHLAHGFDA